MNRIETFVVRVKSHAWAERGTRRTTRQGLKTAVRLAVLKAGGDLTSPPADRKAAADIAASFQHVAIRHLEQRLKRAVALCRDDPALSEVAAARARPHASAPRGEARAPGA
jgi:hypothetical protein